MFMTWSTTSSTAGVVIFSFFFSSRRRHTRSLCDWSSDVCSSDLKGESHSELGRAGPKPHQKRGGRRDGGVRQRDRLSGGPGGGKAVHRARSLRVHGLLAGNRSPGSESRRQGL